MQSHKSLTRASTYQSFKLKQTIHEYSMRQSAFPMQICSKTIGQSVPSLHHTAEQIKILQKTFGQRIQDDYRKIESRTSIQHKPQTQRHDQRDSYQHLEPQMPAKSTGLITGTVAQYDPKQIETHRSSLLASDLPIQSRPLLAQQFRPGLKAIPQKLFMAPKVQHHYEIAPQLQHNNSSRLVIQQTIPNTGDNNMTPQIIGSEIFSYRNSKSSNLDINMALRQSDNLRNLEEVEASGNTSILGGVSFELNKPRLFNDQN